MSIFNRARAVLAMAAAVIAAPFYRNTDGHKRVSVGPARVSPKRAPASRSRYGLLRDGWCAGHVGCSFDAAAVDAIEPARGYFWKKDRAGPRWRLYRVPA